MLDPQGTRGRLEALKGVVDARLAALAAPPEGTPSLLVDAVRHSLLAPAKRLRPVLAMLAAEQFGGDPSRALDPGCAIEMVHTASLILDDLPCMDDARLRRGRPTAHVAFGEDAAILAAIALLNESYGVVARAEGVPADCRATLVSRLSSAVGFQGLVAGQLRDLRDKARTAESLSTLNHQKTGVLFVAAAEAGACVAGATEDEIAAAGEFGRRLGLAFQIRDDLLDSGQHGLADRTKDVGKDAGKTTLVALVGPDRARQVLRTEVEAALSALGARTGPLPRLAELMFAAPEKAAAAA
jgi:geranylgeranyl pyrophosphate synthase